MLRLRIVLLTAAVGLVVAPVGASAVAQSSPRPVEVSVTVRNGPTPDILLVTASTARRGTSFEGDGWAGDVTALDTQLVDGHYVSRATVPNFEGTYAVTYAITLAAAEGGISWEGNITGTVTVGQGGRRSFQKE